MQYGDTALISDATCAQPPGPVLSAKLAVLSATSPQLPSESKQNDSPSNVKRPLRNADAPHDARIYTLVLVPSHALNSEKRG